MVLLIQVPLKQKRSRRAKTYFCANEDGAVAECAPTGALRSNVENAVIGHSEVEGAFTEVDGVAIERDERFPIRVTVQFYKATDNGVVSGEDMAGIAGQIERVYSEADYVGSLVTEGETDRPTEYHGSKEEPANWWSDFAVRHFHNSGQDWTGVLELWKELGLRAY